MSELLPCPFCGGEAELNEWPDETAMIVCTACVARGPMCEDDNDNIAAASVAWNRRAPSAAYAAGATAMRKVAVAAVAAVPDTEPTTEDERGLLAIAGAAILALPLPAVASAWQPIETAPKDGTPLLCWNGEMQIIGWWDAKEKAWLADHYFFAPEKWQPLPATPPQDPSP